MDPEGAHGIYPIEEALELARTRGLDLVEIAPNADPPVCKIIDYGKYRYEQQKKEKEARKRQHTVTLKGRAEGSERARGTLALDVGMPSAVLDLE